MKRKTHALPFLSELLLKSIANNTSITFPFKKLRLGSIGNYTNVTFSVAAIIGKHQKREPFHLFHDIHSQSKGTRNMSFSILFSVYEKQESVPFLCILHLKAIPKNIKLARPASPPHPSQQSQTSSEAQHVVVIPSPIFIQDQ